VGQLIVVLAHEEEGLFGQIGFSEGDLFRDVSPLDL
jgi:hypothetical protein